jgi:exopolysaccharide production protein ExoY
LNYSELDPGSQTLRLPKTLPEVESAADVALGAAERSPAWAAVDIGERLAAGILLGALLPLLATVGIVIWCLSRRPPLVAGATLWVLKFRSMWPNSAAGPWKKGLVERLKAEPVPELKRPKDPRITSPFAAFCRKFSIDELPQLWHVVQGRMSLVGPRPMTADELVEHYGRDAGTVLRAKPGLTGLWQIRGRSSLAYRRRRRLDLFLVRKASVRLYLGVLLATIPRVLAGKDAW